ncbi:DUF418 domain-containing protein [Mucilaginibacter myungsuensis]|uniref:DUF418 domain-containing protein n=1 Tax=Mucilaginibacter myungsuensis TaxID=649104 RepID=A0A929KUX2_9SPHI|nr:DUF418 domain-containing protein [Mucilaginibacter myungsuensis]MBE9660883.1 DUF418 domain-containing protein [Mucilaginibacter myungsuensis]MDN3600930.1 DUF418 domain-containing protein [Mucilaginibacter myungsuensis]
MSAETTLKAAPVAQADRITAVDTLRGVALLGILMMNIPYFALPERFSDAYHGNMQSPNFWTEAVIDVLFEGKMRALFSMIFGAGILLFTKRKEEAGFSFKALFFSRMGWMVIFGLIHAHVLLWIGDILYIYGMIGMLAFLFRKMKPKYLVWGVPIVAIFGFVTGTIFYQHIRSQRFEYNAAIAVQKQDKTLNAEQKKAITAWKEVEKEFLPNKAEIAQHTASMKGNYASVGAYIRPLAWDGQTKYLFFSIGDVLALMLLGMAMYKWKFFTGGWTTKQYRLTALVGYGVGLPLVIWNFIHDMHEPVGSAAMINYLETHNMDWWGLIYPFQRMLLVMAHSAVILLILRASIWKGLTDRLAAVGQMAFTNYIMQTVFCTLIFFGYGLNYFAELQYYQLYYIVAAIWIIQLIVSPIWLKYYQFGPLEWLWRTLTYRRAQPMRREQKVSTPAPDPAL